MTFDSIRQLIAERASVASLGLSAAELAQLERYFDILRSWNRTINLTGLSVEPPTTSGIDRLLIEPVAAARFLSSSALIAECPAARWLDLGSGGGSPAIPLKIALPSPQLTMIESRARKAAFLSEVVRALELPQTQVRVGRFDEIREFDGTADLVTIRAVRLDHGVVDAAARFLRAGGWLVAFEPTARFDLPRGATSTFEPVAGGVAICINQTSWLHVWMNVPRGTKPRG